MSYQLDVSPGVRLGYNLAFYPRLLGWAILVISSIILLEQFFKSGGKDSERIQRPQILTRRALIKRIAGSTLLVTLYIILIPIVGYLLLTPIFLLAFIRFLGNKNWAMASLVSILVTGVIYVLFWILLYIPLPEGILIPRII
ncbi:MAG: hypothetical protein GTN74_08260 [Proteobacteria bacterium]|nr:hypothetical protein [Pseudomonadota bacterium]